MKRRLGTSRKAGRADARHEALRRPEPSRSDPQRLRAPAYPMDYAACEVSLRVCNLCGDKLVHNEGSLLYLLGQDDVPLVHG